MLRIICFMNSNSVTDLSCLQIIFGEQTFVIENFISFLHLEPVANTGTKGLENGSATALAGWVQCATVELSGPMKRDISGFGDTDNTHSVEVNHCWFGFAQHMDFGEDKYSTDLIQEPFFLSFRLFFWWSSVEWSLNKLYYSIKPDECSLFKRSGVFEKIDN